MTDEPERAPKHGEPGSGAGGPPEKQTRGRHRRRRDPVQVVGLVMLAIGAVVLIGALIVRSAGDKGGTEGTVKGCIPPDADSDAVPAPPADLGARHAPGRTPLCGFVERAIRVIDAQGTPLEFCVLAALNEAQSARGLMEVTDPGLGGYDGMLFLYNGPRSGGFYMRNTPMPLSIAYFDTKANYLSQADMAPCTDRDGCPTYPADGPFQAAVEVPQGGLARLGIGPGSKLEVGKGCPAKDPA